mmetsp:Transcript_18033/g.45112  ORF Transcript_18033/g.45112 Transcript_18033/m.45112 type:complete len:207 (+) Transcript_18033:737-1357(+)
MIGCSCISICSLALHLVSEFRHHSRAHHPHLSSQLVFSRVILPQTQVFLQLVQDLHCLLHVRALDRGETAVGNRDADHVTAARETSHPRTARRVQHRRKKPALPALRNGWRRSDVHLRSCLLSLSSSSAQRCRVGVLRDDHATIWFRHCRALPNRHALRIARVKPATVERDCELLGGKQWKHIRPHAVGRRTLLLVLLISSCPSHN